MPTVSTRFLLTLLLIILICAGFCTVWGWRRGLRIARHDHSSPSGIWARGLVVSNQFGEPRLELVYSSINWNYGLAWFRGSGSQRYWLGLGGYPAEEPVGSP